ncbi:hypothetical protein Taro_001809 [Colocasia esculenta]|uniref:Uncharacterized protein n=1 Tax=Colocasia esculenta TaxID=4460 RepID=A0A843TH23_COLES|nr:hypothetical protein [Colocasia esculenta]
MSSSKLRKHLLQRATKQRNKANTTTHNQGWAIHDSRRTSGVKHNAEATPRHTPAETKELTEHQSNHVRPESHDTSTNNLHKVEGPQAEPPCTSDTPRGQGTTLSGASTDSTKERVTETAVGVNTRHTREPAE